MLLEAWKSKTMVLQNLHQILSYYVLTCWMGQGNPQTLFYEGVHSRCELFSQKNHLPKSLCLKSSLQGSGIYNRTLECLNSQPITNMKITSSVGNTQVVHMLTEFIEYLIFFSWTYILNQLHDHNRNGINLNVNM